MGRQLGVRASRINPESDYNSTQGQAREQDSHRCGRASSRVSSIRRAFSAPGVTFWDVSCEAKMILMPRSHCRARRR